MPNALLNFVEKKRKEKSQTTSAAYCLGQRFAPCLTPKKLTGLYSQDTLPFVNQNRKGQAVTVTVLLWDHAALYVQPEAGNKSLSSIKKIFPTLFTLTHISMLTLLAIWMDISGHLNAVLVKLQGKDILVTHMHAHQCTWLPDDTCVYFPFLADRGGIDLDTCISVITPLQEELFSHSAGIKPWTMYIKLFIAPFDFPMVVALAPQQMELKLQCNDELCTKFLTSSTLSMTSSSLLIISQNTSHMFNNEAMFRGIYSWELPF